MAKQNVLRQAKGRKPELAAVADTPKLDRLIHDRLRLGILSALAVLVLTSAAAALDVGQKAPDFALNGTDGKPVKLSDLTAKGPVVIYTFIAAFTPT